MADIKTIKLPDGTSYDIKDETARNQMEVKSNKVTSISSSSTDTQYPSAKAVYDAVPKASSTTPSMDGTAAVGTGTTWARADHVHPTDTSRVAGIYESDTEIGTISNLGNSVSLSVDSYTSVTSNYTTGIQLNDNIRMAVDTTSNGVYVGKSFIMDSTGITVTSPSSGSNNNEIATTAFVNTAITTAIGDAIGGAY